MEEKEKAVLQMIAKFGPMGEDELKTCVAECKEHHIRDVVDSLVRRGFIERVDGSLEINTDPYNTVSDDQSTLGSGMVDKEERNALVEESLPDGINSDPYLHLKLDQSQALLFEKMRANVSRDCGYMSQDEFIDWVLREARRMTEV